VLEALDQLDQLAATVAAEFADVRLFFDLGELRGAHYHTGVVFAAYTPGYGSMLANGGRYNEVGRAFGKARPATGFSSDLKTLLRTGNFQVESKPLVLAPAQAETQLQTKIAELRAEGMRVATSFETLDRQAALEVGANYLLVEKNGAWQLQPLQ
jgi:ATP phosphoribosyltransferase regulatory subunit